MEPNDYAALIEGHALFKHGAATLRPNLKAVKSAHRRDRHLGVLAYHPALGLVVTDSEALRLLPISKTTISNFKKDSFQVRTLAFVLVIVSSSFLSSVSSRTSNLSPASAPTSTPSHSIMKVTIIVFNECFFGPAIAVSSRN